jgi:hypothetical protein
MREATFVRKEEHTEKDRRSMRDSNAGWEEGRQGKEGLILFFTSSNRYAS